MVTNGYNETSWDTVTWKWTFPFQEKKFSTAHAYFQELLYFHLFQLWRGFFWYSYIFTSDQLFTDVWIVISVKCYSILQIASCHTGSQTAFVTFVWIFKSRVFSFARCIWNTQHHFGSSKGTVFFVLTYFLLWSYFSANGKQTILLVVQCLGCRVCMKSGPRVCENFLDCSELQYRVCNCVLNTMD